MNKIQENGTLLSKEGRDKLYENMGNLIKELFPILHSRLSLLLVMRKSTDNSQQQILLKNITELHASVLYVIIEIATALRADFRSDIMIERRINLKYLVFITAEFYKAYFMTEKSSWNRVSSFLTSLQNDKINSIVAGINDNIVFYRDNYFDSCIDKDYRDMSLHYDFDIKKLYRYLVNIDEEVEARRICSFLAVVQPLNNLLILCTSIIENPMNNESLDLQETKLDKCLINTLMKGLYTKIGSEIQKYSNFLDKNMHTYAIFENLPEKWLSLFSEEDISDFKNKRDVAKLPILLHYVYIDLGVAIRGFLASEYYIERRLNLIRLNLIMYEGYNKIYHSQENTNTLSLWKQYVYNNLSSCEDKKIRNELEDIDSILYSFDEDGTIRNIRHKYAHIKKGKKLYLQELWKILLDMSFEGELKKALTFLQLLPRIIRLNDYVIKDISEKENIKYQQKLFEPYNKFKSKIQDSNMTQKDKERVLKVLDDGMNRLLYIFK